MELHHHDIGTDPLPERTFDPIHARLVHSHVPQRVEALARPMSAPKPRGWPAIEDRLGGFRGLLAGDVHGVGKARSISRHSPRHQSRTKEPAEKPAPHRLLAVHKCS
jgi:hypothetical protein